jgi:hypothetical protein
MFGVAESNPKDGLTPSTSVCTHGGIFFSTAVGMLASLDFHSHGWLLEGGSGKEHYHVKPKNAWDPGLLHGAMSPFFSKTPLGMIDFDRDVTE